MVRSFETTPVPADVLERVVRSGLRAPSAGYTQGSSFIVLVGPEETGRYWDVALPRSERAAFRWPRLLDAPALVLCLSSQEAYIDRYAEPDKGWTDRDAGRWPVPYWHVDAGMAAMLILLAAIDAGLGALFFGVFDPAPVRRAFGIPEEHTIIGAIALGYAAPGDRPSASLARGRRPVGDAIRRGRWAD